jgi:hypothetical protein
LLAVISMKLRPFLAALVCFALPAVGSAQTADITFGNLFGADHFNDPTFITGGTGLGASLAGNSFIWVCLDDTSTSPDNTSVTFNIGTTEATLGTGIWNSTITNISHRNAILTGVKNMFYNFEFDIIADISGNGTNNTPGTAFQVATWYLTQGYINNVWNGTLDTTAINNLLTWNGGGSYLQASTNSWVADLLNSATNGTAATGREMYLAGSADSNSPIQGVALFNVPEPGSALLVMAYGMLFLVRRRRWMSH